MVFGTSGGAQVGLNLAARYPALVSTFVAHEPPSMMLMADPSMHLAADKALYDTYLRDGVQAATAQFMTANGLDAEAMTAKMSAEDRETFGRMESNLEYWLAHGMLPLSQYRADVKALKSGAPKIIVALGAASVGQLRCHLDLFIDAYNFARRLKTLKGFTPAQFIGKEWQAKPDLFYEGPCRLTAGPYWAGGLHPLWGQWAGTNRASTPLPPGRMEFAAR